MMANRQAEKAERRAKELHDQAYAAPAADPEPIPPEPEIEEPVTEVEEENTPPIEPDGDIDAELERAEQRFKVLQGKYNAEVPRLHDDKKRLEEALAQAQAELDRTSSEQPNLGEVTEDERELLGEDFITVVRKIAAQETRQIQDKLSQDISTVRQQTEKVDQDSRLNAVYSALDTQVPDWKKTNASKEFHAWLAETEPMVGKQRQQLLTEAFNRGDADRVIAIFDSFSGTRSSPARAQSRGNGALQELAGPGQTKAAPPPGGEPLKKLWTRPAITQFYKDVREGKISKEEAVPIEKDILAAVGENRVQ